MSDETGSRQGRQPAEGVRIIRAEEAQAALDAGQAAGRRPDDQPRFGDVPPAPSGPRPAHRFPLPDTVDPAEAVHLTPLAPSSRRVDLPDPGERHRGPASGEGSGTDDQPHYEGGRMEREAPPWAAESEWRPQDSDRTTELDTSLPEIPEEGITVTGSTPEMPHWSEPPTGEVPRLRFDDDEAQNPDDLGAWRALGRRGVRWRDDDDWDEDDSLHELLEPDEERTGALDQTRSEHSDLYSFDEDFERLEAERTGPHPAVKIDDQDEYDDYATDDDGAAELPARGSRSFRSARRHVEEEEFAPDEDEYEVEEEPVLAVTAPPGPRRVSSNRTSTSRPPSGGGPGHARPVRSGGPGRRTRGGAPAGGSELNSRIIVGAVMLGALIVCAVIGPAALVVLSAGVVTLAVAEAYNMTRAPGFRPATLLGLVATVGIVFAAYTKGIGAIPIVTVLLFAGSMLWYVIGVVEARPLANAAVTVMVFVWVAVLGSFSAVLLGLKHGEGLFLGAVLVAVTADVFAFAVGRWIGSHPMAPNISPNKTLEGFVGGIVAAVIVGAIIGKELAPWGGMKHGLFLGLVIGLIAPVGDLFESMLKRDLGLKDSGTVLGGHGGLLDRFDALLLALPAAYFVATIAGIAVT